MTELKLYCNISVTKKKRHPIVCLSFLVAEMGFDGLCPSFATRTPDYVRLRLGGSNPTNLSLYTKKEKTPDWMSFLLASRTDLDIRFEATDKICLYYITAKKYSAITSGLSFIPLLIHHLIVSTKVDVT